MLKLLGCVMIGAASVGFAICFSMELQEHLRLLYEIRQLFVDIYQETQYSLVPMEQILRSQICLQDERLEEICRKLGDQLTENKGEGGAMLWKQVFYQARDRLGLKEEEAEIIENAGKAFFGKDTEENRRNLETYLERLDYIIEHTRSEQKEKRRILQTLSIMSGFLLMLLLV